MPASQHMGVEGTAVSEPSKFDIWSARLTRSRDIFLVGFGGLYAFGYLARALHAWQYNLGVLPGAELQYFVAGLILVTPPAVLIGVFYSVWQSLRWLVRWEEGKEEGAAGAEPGARAVSNRRASSVNRTLAIIFGLSFVLTFVGEMSSLKRVTPDLARTGSTIGMVGVFCTMFGWLGIVLLRKDEPKASGGAEVNEASWLNRFADVLRWTGTLLFGLAMLMGPALMILVLVAWALLMGAFGVLPVLPQELGGGAPHCARLDLDPAKLAPEMAAVLLDRPALSPSPGSSTVRSRPVDVYYSGGDAVLFKVSGGRGPRRDTYELKRASILAVVWCVADGK